MHRCAWFVTLSSCVNWVSTADRRRLLELTSRRCWSEIHPPELSSSFDFGDCCRKCRLADTMVAPPVLPERASLRTSDSQTTRDIAYIYGYFLIMNFCIRRDLYKILMSRVTVHWPTLNVVLLVSPSALKSIYVLPLSTFRCLWPCRHSICGVACHRAGGSGFHLGPRQACKPLNVAG
jgi:hypothetical protein